MGTKERRERERLETRAKILDAARELFVKEGYEAVSMRRIAERIEYSATAIYVHFKDKESLMQEICDTDFRALAGTFQQIARIADPIEKLKATGRAYIEFGLGFPNHYRLMFMTPHPPATEGKSIERGNPEEDAYAFLVAVVREAIEAGRLRPELTDADAVAQAIWAGVHGVISLRIAKASDGWIEWRDARALGELVIEMQIRGLTTAGA